MDTRNWDARQWDDLYRSREQLFSGNANGVLVTEAVDLAPGRALDVGCGEGGDALWLARRGWHVTGVDISDVALGRAAAAAGSDPELIGKVTWLRADLTRMPLPGAAFDLVSAQYLPLPRGSGDAALCGLLAAVAPGGTLLVAFHDPADLPPDHASHGDLGSYYLPGDIAEVLDDSWRIVVNETRPRTAPAPPGTHHVGDVVRAGRNVCAEPVTRRRSEWPIITWQPPAGGFGADHGG
ncbi:MAG TPA: class I SAM-dependent methyltransferase [Pseudonocardiaceae bacterium]